MARIRTIKPEFPQSESMGRVSRDSRLCFIQLWTIADDSGRLRGASRMLASLLYPYDDDAPGLIDEWLSELEREGCIIRYEVEGQHYIQICNWYSHQKIDHPTKSHIPPIPESSSNIREDSRELHESSRGLPEYSREPREASSEDLGSKDLRIKDQGPKEGTPREEFFHLPPKTIPIEIKLDGGSRIEKARAAWNGLAPLIGPECRLMAIQFKRDDLDDCLRIMSVYSDDEIAEAIQNYCNLKTDSEYDPPRYGGFIGFMRGGVEKFVSAANPQDIFKKRKGFESASEREERERDEAIRYLNMTPEEKAAHRKAEDIRRGIAQ